jgi:hypothetical protein
LNLYKFTKEPILVMFNCEPSAHRHAKDTDAELLASAMSVLRKMFPEVDLESTLSNYYRTNWTEDPFARMSYTYLKSNGTPDDCETLQIPI